MRDREHQGVAEPGMFLVAKMTSGPLNPAQPARILLVEDSPYDAYLVETALKAHQINYELTRHEDGENAIVAIESDPTLRPDLVLLDLNLPRREGFEVLRAIRAHPALVDVPVCVLTSSEASRDRQRIDLIGVERYIHKPPTLERFISTVGQAVREMLASARGADEPAHDERGGRDGDKS